MRMVFKNNYFLTIILFIVIYKFAKECLCDRSGSYHINFERIEQCENFSAIQSKVKWNAIYFRYNKTHHAGNGSVEMLLPVGKDTSANFHVQKWGDGGWKRNYLVVTKHNVCRSLQIYFGKFIGSVLTTLGVKEPDKCPIPPGKYGAYNYYIPFHLIDIPFFYGKYKLVINAYHLKERAACVVLYGELNEHKMY